MHEPTIAEAYYATYSANSLLSGTPWATWVTQNVGLIQNILETLEVDLGSETGFMTSQSDGVINCRSTAQGLWLIATLGLSGSFNIPAFHLLFFFDPSGALQVSSKLRLFCQRHVAADKHLCILRSIQS